MLPCNYMTMMPPSWSMKDQFNFVSGRKDFECSCFEKDRLDIDCYVVAKYAKPEQGILVIQLIK